MRVFIGIPFSEKNKKELKQIQSSVIQRSAGGRFSDPQNFHLTLKFIGEIEEEKLQKINQVLRKVAEGESPFPLVFQGFDTFQKGRTHIPWIGVTKGEVPLQRLQEKVETALETLGYKKESRPFQAHMTLGRKVQLSSSDILYFQEKLKSEKVLIEVKSLAVMESTRIDGKLVYPVIEAFSLSNPPATK